MWYTVPILLSIHVRSYIYASVKNCNMRTASTLISIHVRSCIYANVKNCGILTVLTSVSTHVRNYIFYANLKHCDRRTAPTLILIHVINYIFYASVKTYIDALTHLDLYTCRKLHHPCKCWKLWYTHCTNPGLNTSKDLHLCKC